MNKLLLAILVGLATAAVMRGDDWPRYRGPNANGISAEKNWLGQWPADGPKQLWKAKVGIGFSSIAVADGRAYTLGNDAEKDTVFCFDAVTGKELWKHTYPCRLDANMYEGGPSATPAVDGDRVYTLSKDGDLFCFETKSGKIIWQAQLQKELGLKRPEWGFGGTPFPIGDLIVLNAGGAGTAFNKLTGKVAWTSNKDEPAYASPVPVDFGKETALAFLSHRELVAVAPATGKRLWSREWKTGYNTSSPDAVVSGSKFFIATWDNPGTLYDASSGVPREVWNNSDLKFQLNPPVLVKGHLYTFIGDQGRASLMRCANFLTGEVTWSEKSLPNGSLIAADDKLIILTNKGELVIAEANPKQFMVLARAQILGGKCWTQPALANGRLYARNARGDLVCLAMK